MANPNSDETYLQGWSNRCVHHPEREGHWMSGLYYCEPCRDKIRAFHALTWREAYTTGPAWSDIDQRRYTEWERGGNIKARK